MKANNNQKSKTSKEHIHKDSGIKGENTANYKTIILTHDIAVQISYREKE
jgi:hypothetical protein